MASLVMSAFGGETVLVLRPVEGQEDAMGDPVTTWSETIVPNVLVSPGATDDLASSRPNGDEVDATFHFPTNYAGDADTLAGCRLSYGGRIFEVVGDPLPYPSGLWPTSDWCWPVPAREVDG